MIKEILLDVAKIVAVDMSVHYMVAIVQWRGKLIGLPIYQPTPAELNDNREGFRHGMSMIPEPASDWKAVALEFVPKVNGVPSKADTPIAYFILGEKGTGVAFPARFNGDRVAWTHSEDVIDHVGYALLAAGLLKLTLPVETKQ